VGQLPLYVSGIEEWNEAKKATVAGEI